MGNDYVLVTQSYPVEDKVKSINRFCSLVHAFILISQLSCNRKWGEY